MAIFVSIDADASGNPRFFPFQACLCNVCIMLHALLVNARTRLLRRHEARVREDVLERWSNGGVDADAVLELQADARAVMTKPGADGGDSGASAPEAQKATRTPRQTARRGGRSRSARGRRRPGRIKREARLPSSRCVKAARGGRAKAEKKALGPEALAAAGETSDAPAGTCGPGLCRRGRRGPRRQGEEIDRQELKAQLGALTSTATALPLTKIGIKGLRRGVLASIGDDKAKRRASGGRNRAAHPAAARRAPEGDDLPATSELAPARYGEGPATLLWLHIGLLLQSHLERQNARDARTRTRHSPGEPRPSAAGEEQRRQRPPRRRRNSPQPSVVVLCP